MEQTLLVEIDRCWGCKACQVACKQAHQTPPGPGGVEVQAVEGPGAEPSCDYIPVMCQHCSDASCAKACPRGAIKRGALYRVWALCARLPVRRRLSAPRYGPGREVRSVRGTACAGACAGVRAALPGPGDHALRCGGGTAAHSRPACLEHGPCGVCIRTGDFPNKGIYIILKVFVKIE